MDNMMNVAKALDNMYFGENGKHLDEMKMHKLMYFSQREALMLNRLPLFEGVFFAWKYGPVLKEVRREYKNELPFEAFDGMVSDDAVVVLSAVYRRYANMNAWELSALSHGEYSWKKARAGLRPDENGDTPLSLNAMMVDAATEKSRRARLKSS